MLGKYLLSFFAVHCLLSDFSEGVCFYLPFHLSDVFVVMYSVRLRCRQLRYLRWRLRDARRCLRGAVDGAACQLLGKAVLRCGGSGWSSV